MPIEKEVDETLETAKREQEIKVQELGLIKEGASYGLKWLGSRLPAIALGITVGFFGSMLLDRKRSTPGK